MIAARFFAASLLLACWPAAATEMLTEPRTAVDSYPTRLVFDTSIGRFAYAPPMVIRDGDHILVRTSFADCVILCEPVLTPVAVDLGLVPAGLYEVELRMAALDPDEDILIDYFALTVAPGPRLSFVPPHPIEGEEVILRIDDLVGRCPQADASIVAGSEIEVLARLEECAQPPAATSLELPLGKLIAGTYEVELFAGQQIAGGQLEVLPTVVRLQNGRFDVAVSWATAAGETGKGRLVQLPSSDSALFYFFHRANWELMVKVLDGCAINGHYWVYSAASTDVAFEVTVHETGGGFFEISNVLGQPAVAINSTTAFPCE